MSLIAWRNAHRAVPTAFVTLICFFATLAPARTGRADDTTALASVPDGTGGAADLSLPDASPTSPDALATIDLSTGTATAAYTFELPRARGDAQPELHLRYDSSMGVGDAGVGWRLDVPSITRRGASGAPRFQDAVLSGASSTIGDLGTDDYLVDGQLLVPVAVLDQTFQGLPTQEAMPAFVTTAKGPNPWTYFRREVDDGSRYFFDGDTWVIQTKSGHLLQLGVPLDTFFPASVELVDPTTAFATTPGTALGAPTTHGYRWNLVRDTDASGNTVYVVWDDEHQLISASTKTAGNLYPVDIYDTLAPGATPAPAAFAHHVHLTWQLAQYPTGLPKGTLPVSVPYAMSPIWRALPIAQLAFVDVTSATWQSTQRQLVRSYALQYTLNATQTRSFLTAIQETGDCQSSTGPVFAPVTEDASGLVRAASAGAHTLTNTGNGCRVMPTTTYAYSGIQGASLAPPSLVKQTGFFQYTGGFTGRARLVDVNGDAADDLVLNSTRVAFGFGLSPSGLGGSSATLIGDAATAVAVGVLGNWSSAATIGALGCIPNSRNIPSPIGGTFGPTDLNGNIQLAPLPATLKNPTTACLTIGGGAGQIDPGRDFDVDGDGLPDSSLDPTSAIGVYSANFSARDRSGTVQAYGVASPQYCVDGTAYDPQLFGSPGSTATRTIADIDGDGLADLVIANKFPGTTSGTGFVDLQVLPNRGDGRFGIPNVTNPTGCSAAYGSAIFPISSPIGGVAPQQSGPVGPDPMQNTQLRFGDLNGDGMADYAVLDSKGLSICVRSGAAWDTAVWRCTTDGSFSAASGADIEIADLDGSGVRQVVYLPNSTDPTASLSATAIAVSPTGSATKDGLLVGISNGFGATTTFQYATNTGLEIAASQQSHPDFVPGLLPVPAWLVVARTTTNGLGAPGSVGATSVSSGYIYNRAVYDPRDHMFAGFSNVLEVSDGAAGAPAKVTTTTFATTSCLFDSTPCSVAQVDTSAVHAMRGLPLVVEVEENDPSGIPGVPPGGRAFTTTWNEYDLGVTPYASLDGRKVVIRTLFQRHKYLWDETQTASTIGVLPFDGANVVPPLSISVPSTEVRERHVTDRFGNEIASVDYGVVGVDQPILRQRAWSTAPGDTTGWSFRPTQILTGYADASGDGFVGAAREYDYQYSPNGLLSDVSGVLGGALPLPGPSTGRAAPQPPEASQNGTLHLRHLTYDAFGNLLTESTALGPNQTQRCTTFAMDPLYAQLPASVTTFPGGCGSAGGLVTSVQFDRRFDEVTSTMAPDGRVTLRAYDDFGRLAEIDQPDASTKGLSSASLKANYVDSSPVRSVHFQTADGSDAAPTFVDHYLYLDGLGQHLEAIDQAGLAGSIQWIVSGAYTRYPTGMTNRFAKPFYVPATSFPGGNPAGVRAGTLPVASMAGASGGYTYDGFGRILTSSDFNGRTSTRVYHTTLLSVDMRDQEQSAGGSHTGALSNTLRDGHGRLVTLTQTVSATSHGAGQSTTSYAYQATGEPAAITQSFPGGSSSRSMVYDTLGRLVQNHEPNAGTWTYAYDDTGELVGTSDARGCGENLFHDALGRVVAEDYSPCTSAQASYSAPSVSSGAGTEAFYVYDTPPGRLTATWDLAQHSVYAYDARGRLSGVARQIAVPSVAGLPAPAGGSGLSISGTVIDAQETPIAGLTIALSGASQQTIKTDVDGSYAFFGLTSGGSYSVQPQNVANCSFAPTSVANLNAMTTSQVASFMGTGTACGGSPFSTPILPKGNLTISGTIAAPNGDGIPGIAVQLNGNMQGTTHTDASGFYSFSGLASGSGQTYSLNVSTPPAGCTISPGSINNIKATTTQNFTSSAGCLSGVAQPFPAVGGALDGRYAQHAFRRSFGYGAANRPITATSGADVAALTSNGSQVSTTYMAQGAVASASSSYGNLLASQQVDPSGAVVARTYADAAGTSALMWYDNDEDPLGFVVQRGAGTKAGAWSAYAQGGAPHATDFTTQTVLTNATYTYDFVGNPRTITQSVTGTTNPNGVAVPAINPSQWPAGAKPAAARSFTYGDDYRLQDSSTQYVGGTGQDDTFVSPYAPAEIAASIYPVQAAVSTHNRVRDQQYAYDWLGNAKSSSDDANVFFDRSLGAITNGVSGPDQFAAAALGASTLQAQYDAAGHVTKLTDSLTGAVYAYAWDELGRLAGATRTDGGKTQPSVQELCVYDARGERVRTTRQLASGGVDHTVQVFDSLVLDHAAFPGVPRDYERDAKTENVYLGAGNKRVARVFYDTTGKLPSAAGGVAPVHVYLLVGDRLGSTSFTVDRDSSELVEQDSYLAYGGTEADYRPARWSSFREDYRYTGHWDDSAVGLSYFGARFYSPALGRYIGPDPLVIHGPGGRAVVDALVGSQAAFMQTPAGATGTSLIARALNHEHSSPLSDGSAYVDPRLDDSNPYAYCNGNPLACVDPNGLWNVFAGVGLGAEVGGGPGEGAQVAVGGWIGSGGFGLFFTFGGNPVGPIFGAYIGGGPVAGFGSADSPEGDTFEVHGNGGLVGISGDMSTDGQDFSVSISGGSAGAALGTSFTRTGIVNFVDLLNQTDQSTVAVGQDSSTSGATSSQACNCSNDDDSSGSPSAGTTDQGGSDEQVDPASSGPTNVADPGSTDMSAGSSGGGGPDPSGGGPDESGGASQ